mmetsp:Transcript_15731/g.27137  ORF Transcript_15731/g.27137 Transcript_15731/m.27137 type:complete len:115 (+) Transcript_15731:184-528(+)
MRMQVDDWWAADRAAKPSSGQHAYLQHVEQAQMAQVRRRARQVGGRQRLAWRRVSQLVQPKRTPMQRAEFKKWQQGVDTADKVSGHAKGTVDVSEVAQTERKQQASGGGQGWRL